MGSLIKSYIIIFFSFISDSIDDLLILGGCCIFITSLFLFVSNFAGMIGMATIMILIGLLLSKVSKKLDSK